MVRYDKLVVLVAHLRLHKVREKASRRLKLILSVQVHRSPVLNLSQPPLILLLLLLFRFASFFLLLRVVRLFFLEEFRKYISSVHIFDVLNVGHLSFEQ